MQFAPARHFEDAILVGFLHPQRYVVLQFLLQAVPDLAPGDVLAFASGQGRVVDTEVHDQGGLVHLEHGQGLGVGRVGHGHADTDVFNAVDQHDVARAGFAHLHTVQALERQHLVDAALDGTPVRAFHHQHVHGRANGSGADAANANAADKGGEVERRNLQLQGRSRVALVGRYMVEHGVKQGRHVGAPLLALWALFHGRPAVQARGVHDREVELLIGGAELVEQIERSVDHVVGA